MKLRTPLALQEYLDSEMGWRVKEISFTQTAVQRASGDAQSAIARAALALLYAHWEGFVKAASEGLLNFVFYKRLRFRELRPCFIAHGLAQHLDALADAHRSEKRYELVEFIASRLDKQAVFSWNGVVRTHGNLSSEVFKSIVSAVAIDPKRYEPRFNWIDRELLARRNRIAHGERVDFDPNDFSSFVNETLTLMRWFKTDVENCVATKGYLASSDEKSPN